MSEIKFRALDTGTNEWLYFSLRDLIVGNASHNLRLKNWCQYTGLKDKNGKEIFEGDIIHYKARQYDKKLKVKFDNGGYCLSENAVSTYELTSMAISTSDIFEVIGTTYENPELLENRK